MPSHMASRDGTIGPYKTTLLKPLGKPGGQGAVYHGEIDYKGKVLQRAIKLSLLPNQASTNPFPECERLKGVEIDGAVLPMKTPDYLDSNGNSWGCCVMQYVRGRNLSQWHEISPASKEECVEYMAQIAKTIHDAERKGFVHGDIKPLNVMRDINTGKTKVVDWGVCQKVNSLVEPNGGTIDFIAPEMCSANNRPVTVQAKSDVYALGRTVATLNTATRRQFSKEVEDILVKDAQGKPINMLEVLKVYNFLATDQSTPTVPDKQLNDIVGRSTKYDLTSRSSALDVMTDLSAYPEARKHFDAQDFNEITKNLVTRASSPETRNADIDAAAARGLLDDNQGGNYQINLKAISSLSQRYMPTQADQSQSMASGSSPLPRMR